MRSPLSIPSMRMATSASLCPGAAVSRPMSPYIWFSWYRRQSLLRCVAGRSLASPLDDTEAVPERIAAERHGRMLGAHENLLLRGAGGERLCQHPFEVVDMDI